MSEGKEGERTDGAAAGRDGRERGARNGNKIRPVFGEPADGPPVPSADFALGAVDDGRRTLLPLVRPCVRRSIPLPRCREMNEERRRRRRRRSERRC